MALTIVGPAAVRGTANRGVPSAELGIICHRFTARYFPEVNTKFKDYTDKTIVRNVSLNLSRQIAVEGVISGTTGLMAFTLGNALAFGNSVTTFAPSGGTLLLDEAVVVFEESGWRKVAIQASSDPLV